MRALCETLIDLCKHKLGCVVDWCAPSQTEGCLWVWIIRDTELTTQTYTHTSAFTLNRTYTQIIWWNSTKSVTSCHSSLQWATLPHFTLKKSILWQNPPHLKLEQFLVHYDSWKTDKIRTFLSLSGSVLHLLLCWRKARRFVQVLQFSIWEKYYVFSYTLIPISKQKRDFNILCKTGKD